MMKILSGMALILALTALAGTGAIASVAAKESSAARGAAVFERCAACHSASPGRNGIGPSLFGVIGRRVAAVPGFQYSPALRSRSTMVWTQDVLNDFLQSPSTVVPRSRMVLRVPRPGDRQAVISYLATLRLVK
jgi:cytochrome c